MSECGATISHTADVRGWSRPPRTRRESIAIVSERSMMGHVVVLLMMILVVRIEWPSGDDCRLRRRVAAEGPRRVNRRTSMVMMVVLMLVMQTVAVQLRVVVGTDAAHATGQRYLRSRLVGDRGGGARASGSAVVAVRQAVRVRRRERHGGGGDALLLLLARHGGIHHLLLPSPVLPLLAVVLLQAPVVKVLPVGADSIGCH